MLNVMMSAGPPSRLANPIASRSDPGPVALALVTTNVLAPGVTVVRSCGRVIGRIRIGRQRRDSPRARVPVPPAIARATTSMSTVAPLSSVPS